ncbi:MAG: bacillithiol biosynthesis deacetylase BshB1 [Actinomycetota bacterium]|nr:bacillithiol biosynthesis deacetylase BshB1 [Actinomycetota bacterium]
MDIDVLAFGAHPDDAEMGCGGLLLKMKAAGYQTGIADLTRGELSTNGNLKIRARESKQAAEILKLDIRENLGLEDGHIVNDTPSRTKVVELLRACRPRLVITPYHKDRHPDHQHAYQLLKDSIFISGLAKFRTSLPAYRPRVVINYMMHYEFEPSFIVDITDYFKTKMEAVTSYRSQLYSDYQKQSETRLSSKIFYGGPKYQEQVPRFKNSSRVWRAVLFRI